MRNSFIIVFFAISITLNAQPEFKFERYTVDNGLPVNYVLDIIQDHKGFMWFGMRGGCCRFDGVNFKTFKLRTSNGYENITMWINKFVIDNNNQIWVGGVGGSGFVKFDFDKELFVNYLDTLNLPDSIKKIQVSDMICDKNNNIWICTQKYGVIVYDQVNKVSRIMNNRPGDSNSITAGICFCILEDHNGDIWIGTEEGLCKYNLKTRKINRFIPKKSNNDGLVGSSVLSITEDSQKDLWIVTKDGGLSKYNPEDGSFKRFFHHTKNDINLSQVTLSTIIEDSIHRFWIGSNNNLFVTDSKKTTLYKYDYDENNIESINSNLVKTLYVDNTANIWIGTSEGICKLKPQKFRSFKSSNEKNSITQNKVQYLAEDEFNNVWISTPKGIDIYDKNTNEFKFLAGITKNENSGLSNSSICFFEEKGSGMWIGTYKGGLNFYDYGTKKIKYFFDFDAAINYSNLSVLSLLITSDSYFWIGTWDGIIILNEKKEKIKHFRNITNNKETIPADEVSKIYQDKKGRIWIGTFSGVACLTDFKSGTFKRIADKSIFNTDKDVIVNSFQETNNADHMWIASDFGLLHYYFPKDTIIKYDESDGLPSSNIMGVLTDKHDNLWISTSVGLVFFKPDYKNFGKIHKLKIYKKNDGLQGDEFLPSSCVKLRDGTMFFGGIRGMCMFHPDSIIYDKHPPKIELINLEVNNNNVAIGEKINGQVILAKSISNTKSIILNYKNNKFTVEFAALHFNQPKKNKYSYKLIGFDEEWHFSTANERKASYMNLTPGDYTLHIRASNNDDIWNDKGKYLKIKILPPWWMTIWFIVLCIILIVFCIVLVAKLRFRSLQKQKQRLEFIVEKRTNELREMNLVLEQRKEELEQQMIQLENMNHEIETMAQRVHESDQSKLRLFANVSHELRTPLSLIISPLEKCLSLPQPIVWHNVNISKYLKLMNKNAQRLINLINQIIDYRKITQGARKLELVNKSFAKFINDVVRSFELLAESKNITLALKIEESNDLSSFAFDADVMAKILFNLISNAIKYTPDHGKVDISVNIQYHSGNKLLVIIVSDTGIGIKAEHIDRIFERFYRVDNNYSKKEEGTGIGLAYTYELVKLHNGTIRVESEINKGTDVVVSFPFYLTTEIKKSDSDINQNYLNNMMSQTIVQLNNTDFEQEHENVSKENMPIRYSILLVEDNDDLRNFMKSELQNSYNVFDAENGEKGFKLAIELNPDLIISDVMMPVMDGIEFCGKIKSDENTSHIPIVLLTAKTADREIIKGFDTGADDYITKPFKVNILLARIDNLLKSRQQLREKFSSVPYQDEYKNITTNSIDERFLQNATLIVENNLDNSDFSNDDFIQDMGMSRALIYKKIKSLTNMSLSEFIRTLRLKKASLMLLEGDKNISEVAYCVGFKRSEHFSRYFTQLFKQSPSDYIRNHQSN